MWQQPYKSAEYSEVQVHTSKRLRETHDSDQKEPGGGMSTTSEINLYRARNKGMQILLSNSQAGTGRTFIQEQEEISRNHVQAFILGSVHCTYAGSPFTVLRSECIVHKCSNYPRDRRRGWNAPARPKREDKLLYYKS